VLGEALDNYRRLQEALTLINAPHGGELPYLAEELRAGAAAAAAHPSAPHEGEVPPAVPHTPAEPAVGRLADREATVRADADAILAAYARGETWEPYRPTPVRVRREDRVLARQMARLRAARDAYVSAAGDPVRAEAALERFRVLVSESGELLRSAGTPFESKPATDPVPPDAVRRGPHRPGSPEALLLDARARIADLAARVTDPASLTADRLFSAMQYAELETWASGVLGEPLRRSGTEGKLLSAAAIRDLRTDPPWLAEVLAARLAGYQRSHLVGAGFGGEVIAGLALAPEGVNQTVQNRGVEEYLRAVTSRNPGSVEVFVTGRGRRLLIPLAGGGATDVDIMTSVHYEIHHPPPVPLLQFEVVVQPDGRWNVVRNDLPRGAPGANVPTSGYR
jgi:hypothetical protein